MAAISWYKGHTAKGEEEKDRQKHVKSLMTRNKERHRKVWGGRSEAAALAEEREAEEAVTQSRQLHERRRQLKGGMKSHIFEEEELWRTNCNTECNSQAMVQESITGGFQQVNSNHAPS